MLIPVKAFLNPCQPFDGITSMLFFYAALNQTMNHYALLLLALFSTATSQAQQAFKLQGRVTNHQLEPLALVSIQVKDHQQGTLTKEDGTYSLSLDEGFYEIIVTMVGYQPLVIQVALDKKVTERNIMLEPDTKTDMNEVVLRSKAKDFAEEFVKRVIRHKENILAARGPYSCQVYIRAVHEDSMQVRKRKKKPPTGNPDSLARIRRLNGTSMAEISLRFDYGGPGSYREERTGVQTRGNGENLFYLSTTAGDFDCYHNLIKVPLLSETPFLSPVSYSGLVAYRYKTLKTEIINGRKVYTIGVRPAKLSNATVEGEMVIDGEEWVILSTRFSFPRYHLPAYDYFEVAQEYSRIDSMVWMITKQVFTYYAKTNKAQYSGTTLATYNHFELNKQFPPRYFGTELSSASKEAYGRDSSFWTGVRTEPLSEKEIQFVRYRDSIYHATHTKAYLDSLEKDINRVTWKKLLLTGQPVYSRAKERSWNFQPLISFYQPFQFGGARINPSLSYARIFKSKKSLVVFGNVSYGLRNKDVNGALSINRLYNPFNRGYYNIDIRRDFQYIFEGDAWINMIKRSNQYLDNAIGVEHGLELFNGLFLKTGFDIAFRRSLAGYRTNDRLDSLLGDILTDNQAIPFESYNASYGHVELAYTFRQRYIREPLEKIILGSSWPTVYVQWRTGIPGLFGSKVNFNYMEWGLRQTLKLGLVGQSAYSVKTGSFLSRRDLRLVDYQWQRQGDPILFQNPHQSFQSLDSTFPVFRRFYEGHFVHEFNGAILNKIPLLKKLQLREVAGAGFLIAPERELRYVEIFGGVERVFKAPFNIPTKFKLGAYVVGSAANAFRNPLQFKIGITTWNKRRGRWF